MISKNNILRNIVTLIIFTVILFSPSGLVKKSVLAATTGCCPPGSHTSCCAGGDGGGSYTYDCDFCGGEPSPSGQCCITWPNDSCGCPSSSQCDGDSCSCSIGACSGDDDDDDCNQPCGGCFPCNACATIGSIPEENPLMLSFSDAEYGKATEEDIISCQNSLIGTVNAASSDKEVVLSSLNTPIWKLAVLDTYNWIDNNKSLLLGSIGSVLILIAVSLKLIFRNH